MSDATEQLQVLQQLGRTYRAFLSAYEKDVGHFLPRWRLMLHLYNCGHPCAQKELGEASHMDPGALSRQLSSLEALGWISRAADSEDRRITNVQLTKKGEREVEKSLPKRAAFIGRTLGDIPEKQLSQMMKTLLLLETRFGSCSKPPELNEDAQGS